jgi:hypothetical protein
MGGTMNDILELPAGKALKIASSSGIDYLVQEAGRLKELTPSGTKHISRGGIQALAEQATYIEHVPVGAAHDAVATAQPGARVSAVADERHAARAQRATAPQPGSRAPPTRASRDDLDDGPLVAADSTDTSSTERQRETLSR